jgi:hypothetical protein
LGIKSYFPKKKKKEEKPNKPGIDNFDLSNGLWSPLYQLGKKKEEKLFSTVFHLDPKGLASV